jgi:hypothetical protein
LKNYKTESGITFPENVSNLITNTHEISKQKNKEKYDSKNGYDSEKFEIFAINDYLDHAVIPQAVNEHFIRKLLSILDQIDDKTVPDYWLMMARISEVALLCAGYYADNCEFCAAGDFLVNPYKILIHIRGEKFPVRKIRHGKLSEQLNPQGETMDKFIEWFKKNVLLQVCQKSLLEDLYSRMETSVKFKNYYLADFKSRMNRVADAIGFLNSWQINSLKDLDGRLKKASPETKKFVRENLCNFDRAIFNRMGEDINRLKFDSLYCSEFLKADFVMDSSQHAPGY